MKARVAVECRSILLQKALEKFLGRHLSSPKHSDITIYDYKSEDPKGFYIASTKEADLFKPFTKAQLFLALENRYEELSAQKAASTKQQATPTYAEGANFEILQKRIEQLTQEYQKNILEAIKAFYG